MSQTVKKGAISKLVIKNRAPGTISTGANTEVTIDGLPLKAVSFLKLEFKPGNVVKVCLEMYCEVEVDVDVKLEELANLPNEEIKIGKNLYVLGKYEMVGVPISKKVAED